MSPAPEVRASGKSRLIAGIFIFIACTGLMASLRFIQYPTQEIPLPFVLPLLLCIWIRERILLWSMTIAFVGMVLVRIVWFLGGRTENGVQGQFLVMQLINIGVAAGVVQAVMTLRDRIDERTSAGEMANAELQASNEELSAREEEIARQNEELQSQAEELERQTEELRSNTEDRAASNQELESREKVLQVLLAATRDLVTDAEVLGQICRSAMSLLGASASASAAVERKGDDLVVIGHAGFEPSGPVRTVWRFDRSFAALVMERRQTGYLEDVSLRPDLEIPGKVGTKFRSLLAAPLLFRGEAIGCIEVFAARPRKWTDEECRILDWIAAQCSLVLETVRLHREIEARRLEAEEGSSRKTQFLAAVSHDIRTPANAITLLADLIAQLSQDPQEAKGIPGLVRDLQENSRALVELVSDVLEMARYDLGRLTVTPVPFPLRPLLEAEARQIEALARAKGLELVLRGGEGIWLSTDRLKLARVLANLIGNGIKFTESGEVRIEAERRQDGRVEIRVIDTGIGIDPAHAERVFDEFFQLRNPERDRSKGTGLGLAISKRLADAMGLSLSLKSEPGEGSTFIIGVPAAIVLDDRGHPLPPAEHIPPPSLGKEPARPKLLAGLRVLLVEDHESTRRATSRLLAAEGAFVLQAASGE